MDKVVRIALKRHTAEQIVGMLRQVEVELPGGERVNEVCRDLGPADLLPVAHGLWWGIDGSVIIKFSGHKVAAMGNRE